MWTGGSSSSRLRSISFSALTGTTGLPAGVGGVVLGLGRGRHPGEPAAVGADHRDRLGRQLHEHAAQGVPGALDVGGEDRPPDQLAEVGGGDHVVARRGEVGDLGVEARVLARQGELGTRRPRTTAGRPRPPASSSASALVRRIDPNRAVGRIAEPGCSTFMPSTRWRMPTSRSVAIRIEPLVGVGHELDVLEDRLGAPGRDDPADHPERGEQSFAVAQGLHALPPTVGSRLADDVRCLAARTRRVRSDPAGGPAASRPRRPSRRGPLRSRAGASARPGAVGASPLLPTRERREVSTVVFFEGRTRRRGRGPETPDQSHDTKELNRAQRGLFTGGKPVDNPVAPPGRRRRPGRGRRRARRRGRGEAPARCTRLPQVIHRFSPAGC